MEWYNTKLNKLKELCNAPEGSEGDNLAAYLVELGMMGYDGQLPLNEVKVTISIGNVGNVKSAMPRIQTDDPHLLSGIRTARDWALRLAELPEFKEYMENFNSVAGHLTERAKIVVNGEYAIGAYNTVNLEIPENTHYEFKVWAMAIELAQYVWGLYEVVDIANTPAIDLPETKAELSVQDTSYELD
ncbi:hypothetical protein KNV09_gp110 [Vibrio phage Athena]|uniref:Uncharacterized protein n=8 Tax=Thalassavirus TaxID=2948922 RepID=A0A6M4ESG3_9CAUD|nr:hypothetical protein KNU52_gp092 [Vibrio phage Achelous]YP_010102610.1 hypothetical protein KNU58_gp095 [Vibrio phage Brizo]YP_010105771.1 hypothetical protein KNU87_gp108 [Vibrio phage Bennett]YP_010105962.1 hypothetical protein KNU88_gp110 [Vibrio phage Chester]YP_010108220.1 hypothetical protein KNV06_gp109 [Vibrio phage AG74]YP_010108411.1 hypothetical protein KNV07_gp111 [Vibrio phage Cody]YP_010108607.1 hypothetical protein KNV08_gp113 [Vibrio phage Quinn]YP_010108800.1 hypothetical